MKNFIGLLFLLMGMSVYGQTSKIRPYNECETVAFAHTNLTILHNMWKATITGNCSTRCGLL